MPTWAKLASFTRDYEKLSDDERAAFNKAIRKFVEDLKAGGAFRAGLRVKKMTDAGEVWEMTWANDGRATFEFGEEVAPGERHVVWRRIGTHTIFTNP